MVTVNVATLKEKLSYYLRLVKNGREIIVTSHHHPVAKILPVSAATVRIIEAVRPVKDVLRLKGVRPRRTVSVVNSLLNDRRR